MVTIPWHKRVLFLDDREAVETIRSNVAKAAAGQRGPSGHARLLHRQRNPARPRPLVRRAPHGGIPQLARAHRQEERSARARRLREFSADRIPAAQAKSISTATTSISIARRTSSAISAGCRISPATSRSSSPNSAWTRSAIREEEQARLLDRARHHRLRERARRHVHLLVDRRVVHRRRRRDRLGLRHRHQRTASRS